MNKFFIIVIIFSIISCDRNDIYIENIPFNFANNNAQPNLVSSNGTLSLSWISSLNENESILHFSKFENGKWLEPKTVAKGSDWFVNWADFPEITTDNLNGITAHYLEMSSEKNAVEYTFSLFSSFFVKLKKAVSKP